MHAFDVLGEQFEDPSPDRIAEGERSSGAIVEVIAAEFGISQPAVSQHLRVLRDSGFAHVRAEARNRLYSLDTAPLEQVEEWLDPFRRFWNHKLEALATEVARGKKARRET